MTRGIQDPDGKAWNVVADVVRGRHPAELLTFLRVTRGEIPSLCTPWDELEAMRIGVAVTTSPPGHRSSALAEI